MSEDAAEAVSNNMGNNINNNNNNNVRVAVLLSSYNGARYIEEQMTSILQQRGVAVQLIVRDDGSTDDTCAIVQRMAGQYPNITLIAGTNLGVVGSFFLLLSNAPPACQFYALADQDDVWYPDKLSRAVTMLMAHDQQAVAVYCSALENVDQHLAHLSYSERYSKERIGLKNALVQNIATGCTMVLTPAARELIITELPQRCIIHDWWIYIVISALGTVLYDPEPTMQYRQHGGNVIGAPRSGWDHLKRRFRALLDTTAVKRSEQLQEFDRIFGARLAPDQREQVRRLAFYQRSLSSWLAAAFSSGFRRHRLTEELLVRLVVLMGKF